MVSDPKTESRLHLLNLNIYVPRDEQFGHVKFSDFLAYALKSVAQVLLPEIRSLCDKTINEFDTFQDVWDIYEGSLQMPSGVVVSKLRELIPYELLRELVRNDGERLLKFPVPDVVKGILQLFLNFTWLGWTSWHDYNYTSYLLQLQLVRLHGEQTRNLEEKCLPVLTLLSSAVSKYYAKQWPFTILLVIQNLLASASDLNLNATCRNFPRSAS